MRWKSNLFRFLLSIYPLVATIDDPARLIVRPDPSSVVDGSRISFFCRADGNPLPNVVWKINGETIIDSRFVIKSLPSGLSTLRIEPVRSADNASVVSCAADNGVGNPVVADAILTVVSKDQLPTGFPSIDAHPSLKSVEQGRTAHVTCRVHGDPRPKVLWLRDLIPIDIRAEGRYSISTIGNPGALMIQQAREEDQGKYECVARNIHGVVHSKAAHLYVKVRRVPPYFSYKLEKTYRVGAGGSVNLTCVAVGFPMPRVFWKKSDDVMLDDAATAPIGKNVLTLSNVEQTENFTCVAVSKLGNIEATTTVEVKALPPPPRNVKMASVTAESVTLTWEPAHSDEPIIEYIIKYRQKSHPRVGSNSIAGYTDSNAQGKKTVSADQTSVTIDNLEPFQLYEFTVVTVGDVGEGQCSLPREAQTLESAPQSPPTQVQARSLNRDSILVKWAPSERPNGLISGYRIYYTDQDPSTPYPLWKTHETKSDELIATLYGLETDKQYYIHVQAKNSKGSSPMSTLVTVATKHGIPAQPPSLAAKPLDSHSMQLTWGKPMFSLPIIGYVIRFNSTEGEKEFTLTSPHEKHTIMGLEPDTSYAFKVAAQSARGQGEFSEPIVAATLQSTVDEENPPVPSAPLNFEVVLISSNQVKLTWDPPLHSNGILAGYNVFSEKLLNGVPVRDRLQKIRVIKDSTKRYTEIDKLEPNTEYALRMTAFNYKGDGEFTESKTFITGGIPPRQPEIQSVVLLGDDAPLKARVDWKRPQLGPLESPIDRFNLWYRPEGAQEYKKKVVNGTENSAELTGLWMGRVYEIVLGAENIEGLSVNATEKLLTPVGNPEGEPLNVQYEVVNGKMRISWDPPAEDRRNGNITSYKAILTPMDSEGERIEKMVTDGALSTIFSVDTRKAYTFKVAAATMKGPGPFSPVLTINPDPTALVGPPSNVRVEATSNSSAVVQWDFKPEQNYDQIDGFVIKYMHEPGGRVDTERWTARTVMNSTARHLEVPHLVPHKAYAFCVLAIKNNRQGACSDPPTLLEKLTPTYMVQNLHVEWKTSHSVKLRWDYNGPQQIGFYVNHTGKKEYLDQFLAVKSMVTPGYERGLDESGRECLWTDLRPYMQYTFHVGVRTNSPGSKKFWPKEVIVMTDPSAPPIVCRPELDDSTDTIVRPGQAVFRLQPASEEYGPISHYWIVVIMGNYTQEYVRNLEPSELEIETAARRKALGRQLTVSPAKKVKKSLSLQIDKTFDSQDNRYRRSTVPPSIYITARIGADDMRKMFSADGRFIVGDDKLYDGFNNFPLEPNTKYKLMVRAFAKNNGRRKNEFDQRAPMSEKLNRLYADSNFTSFTTKAALRTSAKAGGVWLLGPLIALLIIALLIGMLVCWWLRCNKKSAGRTHRHGSITKVALTGNIMNGVPGETSKLLSTESYGRSVMNPYEQMNGGGNMESTLDLYPMPSSQTRTSGSIYAPVPVPLPCLPSSGGIIGGHSLSHPAIPIAELAQHIERLRLNNNAGFQQEFESIETGQQFTWEHSSAEINKQKNRYANVVAYDHSRVTLSTIDGIPGTDYINANFIDGYDKPKAYIATQGPLPETFADFWRMVWEEGSATIVMLTNLEERSRIKCDQYWPSRGSSTYGDIQVSLLETTVLAHYTMRTFRIQMAGEVEVREIRHLQYTAWPDHGVPDHPTPFLIFLKRVKTLNPPDAGPIISHCSAGIGRTGAFIVIDCMLERLRYENTVDIFGCVTALRGQRSYMVQTEDQYVFIHDAVLDAVNSGSTEVPASKLHQHMHALQQTAPMEGVSGIELEFRHLSTLKWTNTRCGVANLPANRHKNRMVNMVPFDSNRVILHVIPGIDGSDYINSSWIDGYRERGAYLATQGPTEQTLADFWRMVWEHECAIIVMLTKTWELGREKCCEYWPHETGAQMGQLVVEPIAEYNMREYILREFRLSDVQTGLSRTVRHFQYTEWPEQGAPKSSETFLDLIQQVHRTKSQFGIDGPIVVHCSSGTGRTGVFIALAIIIERMRLEHVVDVFTTVKLLRTERQNMVQDKEQYQFLYQAALEYLASYDQYTMS